MASNFPINLDNLQNTFKGNGHGVRSGSDGGQEGKESSVSSSKQFQINDHSIGNNSRGNGDRLSQPTYVNSPNYTRRRLQSEQVQLRQDPSLSNSNSATTPRNHQTFLDRFRSRANTNSPKQSFNVLTSDASSFPYSSSPQSNKSEIFLFKSRDGSTGSLTSSNRTKPRKWYSFTSLLSRSNLKEILTLPKSRLSVSSIFTTTSECSGVSTPKDDEYLQGGIPGCFEDIFHQQYPASPTPSCVTVSGEFPSAPFNTMNNVVYRKPKQQRSYSASAAGSGVTFNNPNSVSEEGRNYQGTSSLKSRAGSRLSCGEFFPSAPAPSSPGFLDTNFQFHFYNRNNGIGRISEQHHNPKKTFGKSLPTLLEAMESASNLNGNESTLDETSSSSAVTVESVSELLHQEYAILTGSKTLDEHYILIFPDRGNFHQLTDEDYRKLMKYLISVPPIQDAEPGFVLIVDRRNDKWNSIKTLLIRISCYFPSKIHRVFILRPVGFLQKALTEVSSKLFRTENLRFRLTVCNTVSDLVSFIEPSQLTPELGGYLHYDKVQWVEERIGVEAYHGALQILSRDLKRFTESFNEYPNNVEDTKILIQFKTDEYDLLKTDLTEAGDHGEGILSRIKSGNGKSDNVPSSVQLVNVLLLERFILQIDETRKLFTEFWIKEKTKLEKCLQLRRFEHEFRELRATFEGNVNTLTEIPEMGETLAATETLILETINFQENTKPDLTRALDLEIIGREIVSTDPGSRDTVEPKYIELTRMVSHFRFIVHEKVTRQKEWRNVQGTIEKANVLCTEGLDLLSTQKMVESTEENPDWSVMKTEIDYLLGKIEGQVQELISLKGNLVNSNTSTNQPKTLVKQVLRRVEDVQSLCSKRQIFILQNLERKSSFFSKTRKSSGNIFGQEWKSVKSESVDHGSARTSFSSSTNSSECSYLNGSDEDKSKEIKRYHVLQELLQTEESYVKEIGLVLTGYRDRALNPDEMKSNLPSQLKNDDGIKIGSNVAVLFCNLDEIYSFHSKIFLPDLSACIQSIELVALCFIQRHSDFLAMYSQYCQLKAGSDTLVKEIGENHTWFLECQEKLGHRLPLSSYLLKPVQRITKYHLLLGSLLKHSELCDGVSELMEALDCMVVVVRSVNDGMHQLHIRGYPAKLSMEGPLLLQGPFTVWIETVKSRLRLKGHSRYLFLYQKSILVCKKTGQQSSLNYEFKNKINLSEVGITEDPKKAGSGGVSKKFEIWIQGRQKVFVLQANCPEIKVQWVTEIKRLLMEQLECLRESCNKGKSGPASSVSTQGGSSSSASFSAAGIKRNKLKACKGATINGWINHPNQRALNPESYCETSESSGRGPSRSLDTDHEEDHWTTEEASNSEDEEESVSQACSRALLSNKLFKSGSISSMYGAGDKIENGPRFIVKSDYVPIDPSCEIALRKGQVVVLLKTGCAGWWFVKSTGNEPIEGWAPSGFLDDNSMTSSMSSQSVMTTTIGSTALLHKQSSVPCLTEMNPGSYTTTDNKSVNFEYEASVISKMCSELSEAGSSDQQLHSAHRRSTDPEIYFE